MINNTMYDNLYCAAKSIQECLNLNEFESGILMSNLNHGVDELHRLIHLTHIVPVQYRVSCVEVNGEYFICVVMNTVSKKGHVRMDFVKNNSSFTFTMADYVDFD